MHEADPYATGFPTTLQGRGEKPISVEALNYDLSIGEAPALPNRKKRDKEGSILRDDEKELFGVLDQKYGAPAADTLISQAESYGTPPQSEDEALERLASMTEAAEKSSSGRSAVTFIQLTHIQGRPYLMWANSGSNSQLYIQSHTAANVIPMRATRQVRRRARPVVLQSEYIREHDTNGKVFGVLPLRGGERVLICSKDVVGNNGTQPVALRNIFELDNPQHAADRIAQTSIGRRKAALVIDVHALAAGEKPTKTPKKRSIIEQFDRVLATIAESRPKEAFRKVRATLGSLALHKSIGAFAANHSGKIATVRQNTRQVKTKMFTSAITAAEVSAEYFTHETKGKRRCAAAVGLVALVGSLYAAYRFGIFTSSSNQAHINSLNTPARASIFDQSQAVRLKTVHDPQLLQNSEVQRSQYTVQQVVKPEPKTVQFTIRGEGNGIWSTIEDYFRKKNVEVNDQRISQLTNQVLVERHLDAKDTLRLPHGWEFSLPRDSLH